MNGKLLGAAVLAATSLLVGNVGALSFQNNIPRNNRAVIASEAAEAVDCCCASSASLSPQQLSSSPASSRRGFFQNAAGSIFAASSTSALFLPFSAASSAADDEEQIEVYFGCGCFWHVQHEFVEAERTILGRSDDELTSRAGYAGGTSTGDSGKVCYHNAAQIADYGSLGHAEVVRVKIPPSKLSDFCVEYCKLFDSKGYRPDQFGDVGPEYRNLVGFPGGVSNAAYTKALVDASVSAGDKLDFAKGKGNDPDRRGLAFVMDTADFPFYVAEQYHQFHDGFNLGENYPAAYNGLAGKLSKRGTLGTSKCPNGLLGVGALGL